MSGKITLFEVINSNADESLSREFYGRDRFDSEYTYFYSTLDTHILRGELEEMDYYKSIIDKIDDPTFKNLALHILELRCGIYFQTAGTEQIEEMIGLKIDNPLLAADRDSFVGFAYQWIGYPGCAIPFLRQANEYFENHGAMNISLALQVYILNARLALESSQQDSPRVEDFQLLIEKASQNDNLGVASWAHRNLSRMVLLKGNTKLALRHIDLAVEKISKNDANLRNYHVLLVQKALILIHCGQTEDVNLLELELDLSPFPEIQQCLKAIQIVRKNMVGNVESLNIPHDILQLIKFIEQQSN